MITNCPSTNKLLMGALIILALMVWTIWHLSQTPLPEDVQKSEAKWCVQHDKVPVVVRDWSGNIVAISCY